MGGSKKQLKTSKHATKRGICKFILRRIWFLMHRQTAYTFPFSPCGSSIPGPWSTALLPQWRGGEHPAQTQPQYLLLLQNSIRNYLWGGRWGGLIISRHGGALSHKVIDARQLFMGKTFGEGHAIIMWLHPWGIKIRVSQMISCGVSHMPLTHSPIHSLTCATGQRPKVFKLLFCWSIFEC